MPIHEYVCKSCLREFEELVFDDRPPACPHCGASRTEKLISRPCRPRGDGDGDDFAGGDAGFGGGSGGCAGCSGGSCATCGH